MTFLAFKDEAFVYLYYIGEDGWLNARRSMDEFHLHSKNYVDAITTKILNQHRDEAGTGMIEKIMITMI